MDFILGILGVMQITFIPGLILYRFFRLQVPLVDRVMIIFGTSMVLNYCVIFLLTILGIYTRTTLSILILGELAAIFWLYRNSLKTSSQAILEATQNGIDEIIHFFFPQSQKEYGSFFYYFLGIVLLLLSARSILWAVGIFIQNLGSVFSAWDAVVSWNSWAMIWAKDQIPQGSHFYPQLIPANWSITYVLLGGTTIQFFAKGIMPLFTLMILVGLFNLSVQTKRYSFLISLILLQPLLKNFINSGLSSGYVDIVVAFFAFAAIYVLIKAQDTMETEQRVQLYILGMVFSAGAAVTKQTGVYMAVCYAVLVLSDMLLSKPQFAKLQHKRLLLSFASISVIWVSWYAFKEIQILTGADRANIDTLINLSASTYENMGLFQQIATAIGQHTELIILFILIAVTFPWMDRFYKVLTLLFAPYPLIWAWVAAYDTRNLAIFLPVLALVSGYSINRLISKLLVLGERTKLLQTPFYVPIAFACLALFSLNSIVSPQKLLQRQEYLQKQIFSPLKNQMLYDLVAANGPQTRILTNYPMNYLPGLEQYQVRFNFQDYNNFLSNVQNPEIEYILIPNAIDDDIKDYLNTKIEAGDYQVLFKDKQWKVFTLIRILNRE